MRPTRSTDGPFSDREPFVCYLCGLPVRLGNVHRGCVEEYRAEVEARSCYVCGDLLDADQPDHAAHASCIAALVDPVAPETIAGRRVEDVALPDGDERW